MLARMLEGGSLEVEFIGADGLRFYLKFAPVARRRRVPLKNRVEHALWYSVAEPVFDRRMDTTMDIKCKVGRTDSQAGFGVRFGVHFSTKRGRFGGFTDLGDYRRLV
jgi:hypothetical protein